MTQKLNAIYENGVLRLLQSLEGVAEKSEVRITVETLDAATAFVDCVGILPDEDAAELKGVIDREFEQVDRSGR